MTDDEYGALLLAPLAGDPPGPSRVDVSKAMRDGRRRRRWLRWSPPATLTAVVAALITGNLLLGPAQLHRPQPVLPPEPKLPQSCTAALLPLGRWKGAELEGGDSTGRWLVGVSDPFDGGDNRMLVWHDGKLVVEAPKQYAGIWMNDINSSGIAVGWRAAGNGLPFAYRDGRFIQLKGGGGKAVAITDAGVVAGLIIRDGRPLPVRWSYPGAEPELLAMPPDPPLEVEVAGIAPDGTVVGRVGNNSYQWLPDGTARRIPPPSLPGASRVATMAQMVRFGWIYAAVEDDSPGPSRGPGDPGNSGLYRFEPGSGTWQRLAGNSIGPQLIGNGTLTRYMQDEPSLWVGRQVLKLSARPASLPASAAETGYEIRAVSDDVQVLAGTALSNRADPAVPIVPVIWRCR